jgi:hypothetical protein
LFPLPLPSPPCCLFSSFFSGLSLYLSDLIVVLLFSVVPFMIALILIFLWLMIDQAFLSMKQTQK